MVLFLPPSLAPDSFVSDPSASVSGMTQNMNPEARDDQEWLDANERLGIDSAEAMERSLATPVTEDAIPDWAK